MKLEFHIVIISALVIINVGNIRCSPVSIRKPGKYVYTGDEQFECPRGPLAARRDCFKSGEALPCTFDSDCDLVPGNSKCCTDNCGSRLCYNETDLVSIYCRVNGNPEFYETLLQLYQPLEQFHWNGRRCLCGFDGEPMNCTLDSSCCYKQTAALNESNGPIDQDNVVLTSTDEPPSLIERTIVGFAGFIKQIMTDAFGGIDKNKTLEIENGWKLTNNSWFNNTRDSSVKAKSSSSSSSSASDYHSRSGKKKNSSELGIGRGDSSSSVGRSSDEASEQEEINPNAELISIKGKKKHAYDKVKKRNKTWEQSKASKSWRFSEKKWKNKKKYKKVFKSGKYPYQMNSNENGELKMHADFGSLIDRAFSRSFNMKKKEGKKRNRQTKHGYQLGRSLTKGSGSKTKLSSSASESSSGN